MATLGTSTVLGDLTVTGEIINNKLGTGNYVPISGGTMTGDLTIKSTSPTTLSLLPTDNVQGLGAQVIFGSTDNQHVRIRANHYDAVRAPFGLHIEKCSPNTQTGKAYLEVEGEIFANGTSKVYHESNKPTPSAIGAARALTSANGYEGLTLNDGSVSNWIRTTLNGIIPYQSGGASSLGTSAWPFAAVYANAYALRGVNLETLIPIQIGDSANITARLPKSGFYEKNVATTGEGYPMTPANGWMHLINCQHSNTANNYALQIAAPFHEQRFFMRCTNGSGATGWSELVVENKTINAQLRTLGRSTSWIEGARGNQCLINQTTYSGWFPIIRAKSSNGAWTMGNYASNIFYLNYTSDTTMSAGTNTCDKQFLFYSTGNLTVPGEIRATKVYNSVWNDYAEYFEKKDIEDQDFEPGDVIVSDGDKYLKSTKAYQETVIGVFSDSFGHIVGGTGDQEKDDKECIPVGLAGRVYVKVTGKVKNGQLLTSSDIPGVAMYAETYKPGTIIGKAVEDKNTDGIGKVKMFIMNI